MKIEIVNKSMVIPLKLKDSDEYIYIGAKTVIPGGSDSIDPDDLRMNQGKGTIRVVMENPRDKFKPKVKPVVKVKPKVKPKAKSKIKAKKWTPVK